MKFIWPASPDGIGVYPWYSHKATGGKKHKKGSPKCGLENYTFQPVQY